MARDRIHTINLAVYPEVLTVAPGDRVRVITEFDYIGPKLDNVRMISAIWHPTLLDPHDEIVRGNKTFTIPSSPPPGNRITVTMDLLVPSGEVGTDYGLYSSIRDVPGADIYTQYYANIITIKEVEVIEFYNLPSETFSPWNYATHIDSQWAITALSYSRALLDYEQGIITAEQVAQVQALFGQVMPEVPPPEGTISNKQLEYDEARASVPAYDIPQNQRGLVHIWGRNDTLETQRMGISWIVRDPDGLVVEEYSAWEAWPSTGAGSEHEFIGGRFNLDKVGTYLLSVVLYMNPAAPEEVDSYYGALCTVKAAEVVPPTKIVGWTTPGSAKVGTSITLTATIKNYGSQTLLAKVEGELFGYIIPSKPRTFTISAGATKKVTLLSFAMPNQDIVVTISSFHQEGTDWIKDDSIPVEISLEPTPEPEPTPAEGYTLSISIEPSGAGYVTKSPDKDYYLNEYVILTAYPASGYTFSYWQYPWAATNPITTAVFEADKEMIATFRRL